MRTEYSFVILSCFRIKGEVSRENNWFKTTPSLSPPHPTYSFSIYCSKMVPLLEFVFVCASMAFILSFVFRSSFFLLFVTRKGCAS